MLKCKECGLEITTYKAYNWHIYQHRKIQIKLQYLTAVTEYKDRKEISRQHQHEKE